MGIAMWVFPLLLPLNLGWWFLLKRYPGKVPLRSSGEGLAARSQVIRMLGLVCALVFCMAGILAVAEGVWEITPVLFAWSYVTFAMRAAHLAAVRQSSVERSA
jgi:hypothetical protein